MDEKFVGKNTFETSLDAIKQYIDGVFSERLDNVETELNDIRNSI